MRKVFLQPGEDQNRDPEAGSRDAFQFYDETKQATGCWNPASFDVLVGSSSRDIRLKGSVTL